MDIFLKAVAFAFVFAGDFGLARDEHCAVLPLETLRHEGEIRVDC